MSFIARLQRVREILEQQGRLSTRALESLLYDVKALDSPTFIGILATIAIEIVLGRFFHGKWPHLASAYISGISLGILIKSPALWPFLLCAALSISSKYVLRIGNRHLRSEERRVGKEC